MKRPSTATKHHRTEKQKKRNQAHQHNRWPIISRRNVLYKFEITHRTIASLSFQFIQIFQYLPFMRACDLLEIKRNQKKFTYVNYRILALSSFSSLPLNGQPIKLAMLKKTSIIFIDALKWIREQNGRQRALKRRRPCDTPHDGERKQDNPFNIQTFLRGWLTKRII